MPNTISKFLYLISNIRNWYLYTFYKERRHRKPLYFITRPHSLRLRVDSENYAVFKEIFVEDFYRVNSLLKGLRENPIVIDIGANRGLFCALMLSKKPGSVIFAYEPLPENIKVLTGFKESNAAKTDNLHLFRQAVSDGNEKEITIFTGGPELGSIASIYKEFDNRNLKEIKVPAISLKDIFEKTGGAHVDIMKIDCEGAEYPILYNTPVSVLQRTSKMVIETHELDSEQRNTASLGKFLAASGFTVTTEKFRNDCYLMTAVNNHTNAR